MSAIEKCLEAKDLICAESALTHLRQQSPGDRWGYLQERIQRMRSELEQAARRKADSTRRQSQLEQEQAEAKAAAAEAAEVAKAVKAADEAAKAAVAAAKHATEPVARNDSIATSGPLLPDRPPRLDPESRQRNPVRYPNEALGAALGGTVMLDIYVDAEGIVRSVGIARTSGSYALDRAAMDAARLWRYEPAIITGRTMPGRLQLPVKFDPEEEGFANLIRVSKGARERVAARDEAHLDDLLERAQIELHAGRYDAAIALGESALKSNPNSEKASALIHQARSERHRVMIETTID